MKIMLRKIFIFTVLALFSSTSFSQGNDLDIRYGAEFNVDGKFKKFIGQINEVIYVWSKEHLTGVDANSLNPLFETDIEMPSYNEQKGKFLDIVILGRSLVLLVTVYDKKVDKNYLFAQTLSDRGSRQGNMVQLEEIDAKVKWRAGAFSIVVKDNRLLVYSTPPFEKYAMEKFAFKIFDNQLQTIWEKDMELPYADRFFVVSDFLVDENDNLHMLCQFDSYSETRDREGQIKAYREVQAHGAYQYRIVSYYYKTQDIKEFKIEFVDGLWAERIGYMIDVNGDINVSGTYAEKAADGAIMGVFFTKVDHVTRIGTAISTQKFDNSFRVAMAENAKSNKGRGLGYLQLDSCITVKDGGLIICGEIFDVNFGPGDNPDRYYIYGTIVLMHVGADGSIKWVSTIPKLQHTKNDGGTFSSYVMFLSDDELYFFFNDNEKNYDLEKKDSKIYEMAKLTNAVVTIARVDMEGKITVEPNRKLKEDGMLLYPQMNMMTKKGDNNRMILLAKKILGSEKVISVDIIE